MRHAEPLGEDDTDLAEALVVGLEPGQHEVELFVRHRRGKRVSDDERIGGGQRIRLDVDGAIGAARQRLANHLADAGGAGRADDDLPTVLLLEPQRLFERIGIRLVELEAGVAVANPRAAIGDSQLPLTGDDLLDANRNFHDQSGDFVPRTPLHARLRGPMPRAARVARSLRSLAPSRGIGVCFPNPLPARARSSPLTPVDPLSRRVLCRLIPGFRVELENWKLETGDRRHHLAAYSSYRLNSSAPLVPPKPKELDSAYSILAARFTFGT